MWHYTREEYEELQQLRYVAHTYEPAAYTLDRQFCIMRECIGTRESYQPQRYQPDTYGWTMPAPYSRQWGIVRHAGYYPLCNERQQSIKCSTIEEALQVIAAQEEKPC